MTSANNLGGPIAVVGGGLAAGRAVVELRELGYDREIVLLADEPVVPYERPPLSKGYLQGEATAESAYVRPQEWYDEHKIDLRTGTRVTGLDLAGKRLRAGGEEIPFGKVLLATGARARRLPLTRTPEIEVRYLRSLQESTELRNRLGPGRRLLVLGAGWIGMEVAATARTLGTEVTVVDPAPEPLAAVLGEEVGSRFAAFHRSHGVDLRMRTVLEHLDGPDAVLSDGTTLQPETVLVAVGAVPSDELAHWAGLDVHDGVLVDAALRTSHPDVVAAGDVARVAHPVLGTPVRVEHWQNAIDQSRVAARTLLDLEAEATALPYFFTDQFDWGMEFFGHLAPGQTIPPAVTEVDGGFVARWTDGGPGGRTIAAMHVNDWDHSDELRGEVDEAWGGARHTG
jgi:3-phenylpropionate/trans-cinnamate dioxygenase ferredoxin reductase subunit